MHISIIGLGWLGLPLAVSLQESGHTIIGSTTSPEKKWALDQKGIDNLEFRLDPFPIGTGFHRLFEANVLIITIPPKARHQSGEFYLEQLKYLRDLATNSKIKKVIFISSTSVYPKETKPRAYHEKEEIKSSQSGNETLLKAEALFQGNDFFDSTILRFGGLMGADRVPITYFSGKENVDGESRVNYIHQADAVRMIEWIIENELWNRLFNGVAPNHPSKREVIEASATWLKMALPKSYLEANDQDQRLIDSSSILATGFGFSFPNPVDFSYASKDQSM